MLLPSAVHVSSTFEFGVMFHDCLSPDPQKPPPLPKGSLTLPSTLHKTIKLRQTKVKILTLLERERERKKKKKDKPHLELREGKEREEEVWRTTKTRNRV